MYRFLVANKVRRSYALLSRGDYETLLAGFDPNVRWVYTGSTSLAGELHGRDAVRSWFTEAFRLVPNMQFAVSRVLVGGPPWNVRIAVEMKESARLADGTTYTNRGVQLVRLRMGRVTEDIITWFDQEELRRAIEVGAAA